jgi:GNAT superfamily N-acetyltransferase
LVGYALFHDAYEPVFAARGIYLSDIYVAAGARRHGIGRALLSAVARDGATRRRTFVWWVARGDDARMFYRTLANVEQPVTAHAVTFEAFERLLED